MKKKKPESLELFGAEHARPLAPHRRTRNKLPRGLKPDKYELDDDDGLVREIVGPWARDKHARLTAYIAISAPTRRKWIKSGAAYIDLFAGPGRCRIRDRQDIIDGGAVCAWHASVAKQSPFTKLVIADAHDAICEASRARLETLGAPVVMFTGEAAGTVGSAVSSVPRDGLHLAFLDPYKLDALPFSVIREVAALSHVDILMHVSLYDLTRNLRRYIQMADSPLDAFAPGWRSSVDVAAPDASVRAQIFHHWRGQLRTLGMKTTEAAELVSGEQEQPLYWLAFAARHPLALRFWETVRDISGQRDYLRAL